MILSIENHRKKKHIEAVEKVNRNYTNEIKLAELKGDFVRAKQILKAKEKLLKTLILG